MRQAADGLAKVVGVKRACGVLGVPRASFYRHRIRVNPSRQVPSQGMPVSARRLNEQERSNVLEVLNSQRFVDASPRQVWASLLDEGIYLYSWRSMYRILHEDDQVRERRNQLTPSDLPQARTACTKTQSVMELGYKQATRTGQMDLLLSLSDGSLIFDVKNEIDLQYIVVCW